MSPVYRLIHEPKYGRAVSVSCPVVDRRSDTAFVTSANATLRRASIVDTAPLCGAMPAGDTNTGRVSSAVVNRCVPAKLRFVVPGCDRFSAYVASTLYRLSPRLELQPMFARQLVAGRTFGSTTITLGATSPSVDGSPAQARGIDDVSAANCCHAASGTVAPVHATGRTAPGKPVAADAAASTFGSTRFRNAPAPPCNTPSGVDGTSQCGVAVLYVKPSRGLTAHDAMP